MNPLHSRNTSGFALSISTGMAMETLFQPRTDVYDPERVSPPRSNITVYTHIWINVLTLVRNAYNSTDRKEVLGVSPSDMADTILQEMELIRDLLKIEGKDVCQPVFYFTDHSRAFKVLPEPFKMRVDKSELQLRVREVFNRSKAIILQNDASILDFKGEPRGGDRHRALMLTHLPLDLLAHRHFGFLSLLESHTGKIKSRTEWNSKYHKLGDTSLERLPFCRPLLYVFGDNTSIVPFPLKMRRAILEVAEASNWTPITSSQRVMSDIAYRLKDPALVSLVKQVSVF